MYAQSNLTLHRLQDGENTSGLPPDSPLNSLREKEWEAGNVGPYSRLMPLSGISHGNPSRIPPEQVMGVRLQQGGCQDDSALSPPKALALHHVHRSFRGAFAPLVPHGQEHQAQRERNTHKQRECVMRSSLYHENSCSGESHVALSLLPGFTGYFSVLAVVLTTNNQSPWTDEFDKIELSCLIESISTTNPRIEWKKITNDGPSYVYFDKKISGDLENRAVIREPATLLITNATRSDTARYRCEVTAADDQKSFDEIVIDLVVRVKPVVPKCSVPKSVPFGKSAQLTCVEEEGFPKSQYQWFMNREEIPDDPKTSLKFFNSSYTLNAETGTLVSASLMFIAVRKEDAGNYFCRAKNDAGYAECPAQKMEVYDINIVGIVLGVLVVVIVLLCITAGICCAYKRGFFSSQKQTGNNYKVPAKGDGVDYVRTEDELIKRAGCRDRAGRTAEMSFFGFGQSADIDIVLNDAETRKKAEHKSEDGRKDKYFLFYDGETVSGKVNVTLKYPGKRLEHNGIKVEFIGQIELYYDRGNHHEFVSLVKDLARPGELTQSQTFDFEFTHVEKPYESYTGQNVKLRYFLRATISRRLNDISKELDIVVHTLSTYPELNSSIKMEVGIEDCLHIEFEYNKSKYHLKDVIVGKIYFLLVRIKIRHMEIDIIKRETTGTGPNVYHENDTIAKYEIMDGAPVRGESIPIRLFLAGYEMTPTMRDINKKFSVRYYLNLVLIDEEERRYFKQQEITLWRKGDIVRKSMSHQAAIASQRFEGSLNPESLSKSNNEDDS
ncbi:hypothetical protein L3Q82_021991 [Scortum barcoo]|uniref:Uncharacterized protein n=1 Tax=Scortum barcoo TaxID=214431 RepID=A0ACB8X172_9TELE|nr:hypothetical protein L3Q82_021991 [Scortum barcoo]